MSSPPPTTSDPTVAGDEPLTSRSRPLLRGWTHLVAFVAMLVAGPLLVLAGHGAEERLCLTVYVVSLTILFGVSAAFHCLRWGPVGRRRMRRLDHSTIFVAIAGTYTAVAGLVLTGWAQTVILAVVWVGALVGVLLRQTWLDAPKWAIALPYVVVGWCALLVVPQLYRALGGAGFALLLAGGLAYTAGALVYAAKRPDPVPHVFGYHEIFHLCTVVGAALQFVAIAVYCLPAARG